MNTNKNNFQLLGFSKTALIIVVALVIMVGIGGGILYLQEKEDEFQPSSAPATSASPRSITIPAEFSLAKRLIKSEDIILEKADITPKIPQYSLPLEIKDISNYQKFSEKIYLSPKALSLLEKNGFVVIPTPKELGDQPDDFVEFYSTLKGKDLPIFITTDSLLHYYHIFFNTTLMKLERDLFYDDIWQISKELFDDALSQYNTAKGDLKEAAKRNVAYLSVALELLKPKEDQLITEENLKKEYGESWDLIKNRYGEKASFKYFSESEFDKYSFEVPDFVKDLVQKEIELIEKHEGWEFSPIFIYKEDYSQYVPRGHYTKSEKLKNYFKAVMWYGRMTNLIKGSERLQKGQSVCLDDGIISTYDAKIQTLQASLITTKFLQSKNIQERWQSIYVITSFFVGFSDDLGPFEYSEVLKNLFKEGITIQELKEKYPDIRENLLDLPYDPKIYGGLGGCILPVACPPLTPEKSEMLKSMADQYLRNTKGFRLMGQRFTIDSYLFSKIISPYSGEYVGDKTPRPFTCVATGAPCIPPREVRGFPRGLDIMALFGSKRAKEILEELGDTEYSDYEKKFSELKKEIDSLSIDDWFQNLYWNWLYVLKSLLTEFGEGYQTFMQTEAWQDKELNTALASWTELRHDTILYVKQSYTISEMGGWIPEPKVVGYVEPVPEFYARLLTLTEITSKGLKKVVPSEELEKLEIELALNRFSEILNRLLEISKKELENKSLTEEEYNFIKNFGNTLESLIEFVSGGNVDSDIFKTVLVADVHTDGNTKKVLEEGVGFIRTLIVAYKLPEGHILVGVGPVFSYYEFKQPMRNRLTDEAWREILNTQPPPEPKWTKSFSE